MCQSDFILVQLSDIHIDPNKPEHRNRWHIIVDAVLRQQPDLVIITGDVSDDGMLNPTMFHRNADMLRDLNCPTYVIPGNHDIGNKTGIDDAVNLPFLDQWINAFGNDRFTTELANWRFIGLNSQILGSGFPRESDQFHWLDQQLDDAESKQQNVALFLHMPIYLNSRDESVTTRSHYWIPSPDSRDALLKRTDRQCVKLIANGHVHWFRQDIDTHHHATRIWCPSSMGLVVNDDLFPPDGECVGFMAYDFTRSTFTPRKIELPTLEKNVIHFNATPPSRDD